jgi:hypothetical protein
VLDILKFADARLREPSTWAGLATLLGLLHLNVDPGLWQAVTLWGTIGAAGVAILLNEAGSKPPAEIAGDVIAVMSAALKAASPPPSVADAANAPPPKPADASAATPAKPPVAAALALLCAGVLALSACSTASNPVAPSAPDQKQALYAVESAYALIANDEASAIRTSAVPPAAADAMRATDNTLYAAIVAWRTGVEAGGVAAPDAIAAVQTALQGLVNQLNAAKALSPQALAAADAALSLSAALAAGA